MSYDDVDSPDYREHNLGDPRMTREEKEIQRLTRELTALRAERDFFEKLYQSEHKCALAAEKERNDLDEYCFECNKLTGEEGILPVAIKRLKDKLEAAEAKLAGGVVDAWERYGITSVTRDFTYDASTHLHTPTVTVSFGASKKENDPDSADWRMRDAFADSLTAATGGTKS